MKAPATLTSARVRPQWGSKLHSVSAAKWAVRAVFGMLLVGAIAWLARFPVQQRKHDDLPSKPALAVARGATRGSAARSADSVTGRGNGQHLAFLQYGAILGASNDYWEFAESVLPAALRGDADAQFYLSRALEYCSENDRMFFEHRGRQLSLGEGLEFAARRHLSLETTQSVFDRCHRFQGNLSNEFGSAAEWLAKATSAGQPLAQASTAGKILEQRLRQNFVQAGGAPDPQQELADKTDPRVLLRDAVKSGEPEVYFRIGDVQGLLRPGATDTIIDRYAWTLIACNRGFDCSYSAQWVRNSCGGDPQCESITHPEDLVRLLAADNWPAVQARAQEIESKLASGDWDDLGI